MNLYLTTKKQSCRGIGDIDVPAGTKGRVIDIMIEDDGKTMFLLEFDDDYGIEWYSSEDIMPCDYATEI